MHVLRAGSRSFRHFGVKSIFREEELGGGKASSGGLFLDSCAEAIWIGLGAVDQGVPEGKKAALKRPLIVTYPRIDQAGLLRTTEGVLGRGAKAEISGVETPVEWNF